MAAVFKFKADGSQYSRGLNQMRDQTKKFGSSVQSIMKSAFTFAGLGGLTAMTRSLISFGSEMSDLALRTKTTVREFMVFRDVARDAGVEQSVLERALRNVVQRTQAAIDGNKTYAKSIERLGLNLKSFNNLSTADKFIAIAHASQNAESATEAFRDTAVILGERAGPMLTEVLKKLATEGFENLADKAVIMTDKTAQELDRAEDAFQKFKEGSLIHLWKFSAGATKIFKGVRAAGGQIASGTDGLAYKFGRVWEAALKPNQSGVKQAYSEVKTMIDDLRGVDTAQIKLAFEEGTYGQELEDMIRERTAKGLAGGLETIRDITSGLITAGQPKEEDPEALKIQDKIAAEKKKQAEAEMKDKEKLASLDEEIAKGLEEYAVIAAEEGKDSIKAKEKELELLKLQTEQKALQKKISDNEKKAREGVASTQDKIAAERKEREEMGMSDEEILARRKSELQQKEQEFAGLGEDANGDGTIDTADDQFRAEKELDIENLKTEIKGLELGGTDQDTQASVISSQLASIGGGGATASFTNDPILNENKRQSNLLEQLVKLQGGTLEGGGNIPTPEL